MCPVCVLDRQAQLERGDAAAQELVNSLQVLEVMAGAMAGELRPLVRLMVHYLSCSVLCDATKLLLLSNRFFLSQIRLCWQILHGSFPCFGTTSSDLIGGIIGGHRN